MSKRVDKALGRLLDAVAYAVASTVPEPEPAPLYLAPVNELEMQLSEGDDGEYVLALGRAGQVYLLVEGSLDDLRAKAHEGLGLPIW